jgi:hypothetical protein
MRFFRSAHERLLSGGHFGIVTARFWPATAAGGRSRSLPLLGSLDEPARALSMANVTVYAFTPTIFQPTRMTIGR